MADVIVVVVDRRAVAVTEGDPRVERKCGSVVAYRLDAVAICCCCKFQ
jgi:hypothetical protein